MWNLQLLLLSKIGIESKLYLVVCIFKTIAPWQICFYQNSPSFFVKKSHCQTKNVEKTKNQMFWHLDKLYFRWKYISMITLPVFFKFLKNYIIWGKSSWLKYVTADNLSKNTILLQCVTTWHLFSHDSYIESGFFLKKIGEFWSTQICHGAMVLNM